MRTSRGAELRCRASSAIFVQHEAQAEMDFVAPAVALLYAHREGYAKRSLSNYLQYVARRKLKTSELQDCFVALAMEATIAKEQNLTASKKSIRRIALLRYKR